MAHKRVTITVSFEVKENQVDNLRGMGYTNVVAAIYNEAAGFLDGNGSLRVESLAFKETDGG